MAKEAKARILINDLLQRSSWRFFDDENAPGMDSPPITAKAKA